GVLSILKQKRAVVPLVVVSLFVATSYLSLRLPAEHHSPPPIGTPAPASATPITMSRAVAEYAGLLILPLNLHMERDVRNSFGQDLYGNTSTAAARELQTLAGVIIAGA